MTRTIRNDILIFAPLDLVWKATTAVADWPRWTRNMTLVQPLTSGPMQVGARFLVHQPLQRPAQWEVTDLRPGRLFAWRRIGGVVEMQARHTLREDAPGTISNRLEIDVTGHAAWLIGPILAPLLSMALMQENLDLKTWCEHPDRLQDTQRRVLRTTSSACVPAPSTGPSAARAVDSVQILRREGQRR